MKSLIYLGIIFYIITLVYLLYVSQNKREKYVMIKTFTSSLFVLTCIISFLLGNRKNMMSFFILFLGLVFCMLGDIALGYCDQKVFTNVRYFKMGVLFFSLAHIFFCIIFYLIVGFYYYDFILPILLVLLALLFERLGLVRLKKLVKIVNVYAAIIGLMTTKALQVMLYGNLTYNYSLILITGVLLFLLSDLFLFFIYFGRRKIKILRYFNLSTYYMGCFLLGITAYYL